MESCDADRSASLRFYYDGHGRPFKQRLEYPRSIGDCPSEWPFEPCLDIGHQAVAEWNVAETDWANSSPATC